MNDSVAIIDIGSNAVRLVIYESLSRAPVKIHNERNLCRLGAGVAATGRLDPDAKEKALDSLSRFAGLIRALDIRHVRAVATAALRQAEDGPAFIEKAGRDLGLPISVIGGEEEARLSSLGVMMNGLGKNGIIGDYGGGSLELIRTENGALKQAASLPIGTHRLHALPTRAQRIKAIDGALDAVEVLDGWTGGDFVALGGAWRSMAKAHIHFSHYPLRVLDHYDIRGRKAAEFAALLSRQRPASLEKTEGLNKKRAEDVGVSALVMERLLDRLKPAAVSFSAAGLREGMLFDMLPPDARPRDPLVAGCESFATRLSRHGDLPAFHALADFAAPLFEKSLDRRLRAACLLSDCAGFEHEDFQGQHAFQRALVLPFTGASHADRAFLALALYVRYKGYLRRSSRGGGEDVTRPAQKLLNEKETALAVQTGLCLRLAWTLTGGALSLLKHTRLETASPALVLKLDAAGNSFNAEAVGRVLSDLAAETGRRAEIAPFSSPDGTVTF